MSPQGSRETCSWFHKPPHIQPHTRIQVYRNCQTPFYGVPFYNYNLGHNILELYNNLVQASFTTSKTNLDMWYKYNKLSILVASRVGKRFKTKDLRKLGNIRKVSNSLWQFFLKRNQALKIAVKKTKKIDTKVSFSVHFLLDFSILFQLFCPRLSPQAKFGPILAESPYNSNILTFPITQKHFFDLQ